MQQRLLQPEQQELPELTQRRGALGLPQRSSDSQLSQLLRALASREALDESACVRE
ncbi:hypothetical protein GCM10007394_05060 [Salinibacterium amurskyense]|nr:hypothetical protein GCM10007394_05060 [Salinibacterium amurskyense]